MRRVYFLALVSILLGGCTLTTKEEKIDVSDIEIPEADHEYFEVQDITINWSDILLQNKNAYYVYIYSLTCTHCSEMKNWIIDEALNRDDIYFVKGSNKDIVKTDVSNAIGATSIENIAILGYPSLLKINNKTLVENVAGKSKIMSVLN